MKRTVVLTLLVAICGLSTVAQDPQLPTPAKPPQKQIVTAAQANGVYRYFKSEFRILALGPNKLKVQFDGVYTTRAKSINTGYAMGEAIIDGNIATFKPPDTEHCEITLVFLPGKLKVIQDGSDADCGFGHNVNATGTYEKIRTGKPKFEAPGN
ncbi:MAG TPA: hypothetical protein VK582_23570 [Pyrinomonadaceae bacterium]|nr:hypothetical protein [Pyrinomonadaceae bacterium]